jgi:hypothetical protein
MGRLELHSDEFAVSIATVAQDSRSMFTPRNVDASTSRDAASSPSRNNAV